MFHDSWHESSSPEVPRELSPLRILCIDIRDSIVTVRTCSPWGFTKEEEPCATHTGRDAGQKHGGRCGLPLASIPDCHLSACQSMLCIPSPNGPEQFGRFLLKQQACCVQKPHCHAHCRNHIAVRRPRFPAELGSQQCSLPTGFSVYHVHRGVLWCRIALAELARAATKNQPQRNAWCTCRTIHRPFTAHPGYERVRALSSCAT